jgi:hypothetical protein
MRISNCSLQCKNQNEETSPLTYRRKHKELIILAAIQAYIAHILFHKIYDNILRVLST